MPRQFFVYILTNRRRTVLYTGVTGNLPARLARHQLGIGSRFASRYNVSQLVYLEPCPGALQAIAREKQIKAGSRAAKIRLIESINPHWHELALRGR